MKNFKIGCLAIAIFLSGCATTQIASNQQATDKNKPDFSVLVKSFGDDTKAIGEKTKTIFTEINSTQLNADITWLTYTQNYDPFSAKRGDLKLTDEMINFPSIPTKTNKGNSYFADGEFRSAEPISIYIDALNNYGSALSNLAVAGSRKDMELASANLYSAALKLDTSYQTVVGGTAPSKNTKDIAAIVSSSIVEIGVFYNTRKRNEALRRIINSANPKIQEICKQINTVLDPETFGQSIAQNRQKIFMANMYDFRNSINTRPTTLAWRVEEIKRLISLKDEYDKSAETTKNANAAIKTIADTHQALVEAINNKSKEEDLFKKILELKKMVDNSKSYKEMLLTCTSGKYKSDDSGKITCKEDS